MLLDQCAVATLYEHSCQHCFTPTCHKLFYGSALHRQPCRSIRHSFKSHHIHCPIIVHFFLSSLPKVTCFFFERLYYARFWATCQDCLSQSSYWCCPFIKIKLMSSWWYTNNMFSYLSNKHDDRPWIYKMWGSFQKWFNPDLLCMHVVYSFPIITRLVVDC